MLIGALSLVVVCGDLEGLTQVDLHQPVDDRPDRLMPGPRTRLSFVLPSRDDQPLLDDADGEVEDSQEPDADRDQDDRRGVPWGLLLGASGASIFRWGQAVRTTRTGVPRSAASSAARALHSSPPA